MTSSVGVSSAMAEDAKVAREAKLAQLLNQTFQDNNQISSTPKIQRVPLFWRHNPDFYKYCIPKMISFGPIHHRNENLKQQAQHLKSQWTSLYIEEYSKQVPFYNGNKQKAANYLYGVVQEFIGELKELFAEDVIEEYSDEELIWMLFEDGCSLLYYMEHVDSQCPEELGLKLDQLMYTWRDILLLENQLPVKLLQLLSAKKGADLEYLMLNFLGMGEEKRSGTEAVILGPTRNHILDFVRSFLVGNIPNQQNGGNQMPPPPSQVWQAYKNIRDLKKSGIQLKVNKIVCNWYDISFTSRWFSGESTLPLYVYNDVTIYLFRNLIAYEMCPDFRNTFECCSFFSFMDSLIDDAEDVRELRSAGVIQNLLRSDQELAEFVNDIAHDLPTKMFNQFLHADAAVFGKKYIQVKFQIENHYSNTWKTWLAEARSTYFNSPWSLLAVLAAFTALVLTFIQTWCDLHPSK